MAYTPRLVRNSGSLSVRQKVSGATASCPIMVLLTRNTASPFSSSTPLRTTTFRPSLAPSIKAASVLLSTV